jgi:hypothetical protein
LDQYQTKSQQKAVLLRAFDRSLSRGSKRVGKELKKGRFESVCSWRFSRICVMPPSNWGGFHFMVLVTSSSLRLRISTNKKVCNFGKAADLFVVPEPSRTIVPLISTRFPPVLTDLAAPSSQNRHCVIACA